VQDWPGKVSLEENIPPVVLLENFLRVPYYFLLHVAANSVFGGMVSLHLLHAALAAIKRKMSFFFLRAFLVRVAPSTPQAIK
jgi:hypothetical protein